MLKRKLWDVIGRSGRARAEGGEIYGVESRRLDCHEVWSYDDERRVPRLVGLKAICSACHLSTHMGRTTSIGRQALEGGAVLTGHWARAIDGPPPSASRAACS